METLAGKVSKRLFAAAEPHVDPHLVSFFEEFVRLLGPELEVMAPGLEADAEHLHFDLMLARPFAFFPGFGIAELTEVSDLNYRRAGRGRNLNDVEPPFLGNVERLLQRNLAEVFSLFVNGPDKGRAYLVVDAIAADRSGILVAYFLL